MTTNTEAVPSEMTSWAPDRIWLQREQGENGSHTWCEDSVGNSDLSEEAEYVRVGAKEDAEVERFLSEVRVDLIRARRKFPGDRIMTIALAEEFGELCKAVLDESAANVRKEAVQTAVMCARVVLDGDGSVTAWRTERGLDALVTADQAPETKRATEGHAVECTLDHIGMSYGSGTQDSTWIGFHGFDTELFNALPKGTRLRVEVLDAASSTGDQGAK